MEAVVDDLLFYDFGFGNQTAYYDVTNDLSFLDAMASYVTTSSVGSSENGAINRGPEFTDGTSKRKRFRTDDIDTSGGIVDEALADYVGVYSEDAFIGRATRVRRGCAEQEHQEKLYSLIPVLVLGMNIL